MQDLTLVIPAKHESESLPIFLNELSSLNCKKLIVLEETDLKTINSIKHFKDIIIVYQKKMGYGGALLEGISQTKTNFFCIINADGSMNPKYLNEMMQIINNKNLDFLFASRYEKPGGGSDDDNIVTSIGNFIFTKIGNIFFSLKITDILFTYVLCNVEKFNKLNLKSVDFKLCIELPTKVKKNDYNYVDLEMYERKRYDGVKKVKVIKDGFLISYEIIKSFIYLYFK